MTCMLLTNTGTLKNILSHTHTHTHSSLHTHFTHKRDKDSCRAWFGFKQYVKAISTAVRATDPTRR